MSEDPHEGASRTEEPTQRKLEQAREKGDVVKTPDLASLASLGAAAAVTIMAGGGLARQMTRDLMPFIAKPETMNLQGGGGTEVARHAIMACLPMLVAVMFAAAVAGTAANLLQTGLMFTPNKLAPDLSRVSPVSGLKRLFGIDGLMQFVKSLLKVMLIAVVAWWVLAPHWKELEGLVTQEPVAMLPFCLNILKRLVFATTALLVAIAAGDWLWQRQRFMARMRMSREELKEEFRQSEGDPHIKARQKQIRNERARRRMIQAVPTATMVVMNPTHYAVALKYEAGETAAPMCVAKGMDSLALKIREVAEAAGVPVIEDPPLARALYATVEVDDMIPPAHYEAVAKLIGFILNAGRRVAARAL